MTVNFSSPKTMPPPTGYSQVAEVTKGKLVLIAGQVAHDANGKLVGEDDFAAQVEQVFKNVDAAVRAAGGTLKDIVKINNYARHRSPGRRSRPSARSATATSTPRRRRSAPSSIVSRLVRPGWLFEIDAMAVIDSDGSAGLRPASMIASGPEARAPFMTRSRRRPSS